MRFTGDFCREQEALQLAKAASDPLENRRKIALTSAKAWASEALLADKQALKKSPLDKLDAEIAQEFADEDVLPLGDTGP